MNSTSRKEFGERESIGVVIPLHNKQPYIARAVESVLRQSYTAFTLAIVDVGSTDGGVERLELLADPRISIIRTQCRGPGAARNRGMRATDADWIALLDADDEWEPTFLEKTVAVARRVPGIVGVFTGVAARNTKYSRRPTRTPRVEEGIVEDYYAVRMKFGIAMTPSSVLLHKATFISIGGFREDYRYAEDIEAWFRLSCEGPTYCIPQILSKKDIESSNSITRSTDSVQRAEGLQVLLESYEKYRQCGRIPQGQAGSYSRFMQHQRGRIALHLINSGQRIACARLLLTSVPFGRHTWKEYVSCAMRLFRRRKQT